MEKMAALDALAGLAHKNRLDVFRHLVELGPGGAPAGRIGSALNLAPATLSFHLKEMKIAHQTEPIAVLGQRARLIVVHKKSG